MPVDFYWKVPTHGDSSSIRRRTANRGDWSPLALGNQAPGLRDGRPDEFTFVDHIAEVAKAAELAGFVGGLVASLPDTDDPWVIAPALARETKTFRFMLAFQPGFISPMRAARMSASLQRATNGRVVYNIITGGGGPSQLWWGDNFAHDDRYERTSEFLDVLKGVWKNARYSHNGRFYQIENGGLPESLLREDIPEIYFSGSSDAALAVAARHADFYISWIEPFDILRTKLAKVKERTAALGRGIRCCIRTDILARPTEEEAWNEARRGFENARPGSRTVSSISPGDSIGGQRQVLFSRIDAAARYDELITAPNIWGGFALLRGGPALGIVGSYEQVAAKLDELIELGADSFILSGTPYLEEAYRVGEEVLPLLRRVGPLQGTGLTVAV